MKIQKITLPNIRKIVAIASGKGGVGKSTIAYNLAVKLSKKGYKVGFLDADIYGPSLPCFTGIRQKPSLSEKKFIPHFVNGVYGMSMGFLLEKKAPVLWRGPLLQTALRQLFQDVAWPHLDILFVDMPPGTGDAHITLGQSVSSLQTVLVSTSQPIALEDTVRCLKTFQKMDVPILGMIENMKTFVCPACETASDIFSGENMEGLCHKENIAYLGSLPLDPAIIQMTNQGKAIEQNVSFEKIMNRFLETAHI